MCYKTIDNYSCGDKEEARIPCEFFIETGSCAQNEQAKQDKVHDHVEKCPECQHFDNEMKKLAEDEELSKPVEKSAPAPYEGPQLYFTECFKWSQCGHISHPRETNIEREPEHYPYIEQPQPGPCSRCALAKPSQIEKMKQDGTYNQLDPWGAMKIEPVAAAGSSSEAAANVPNWGASAPAPAPVSAPAPKAPEPAPGIPLEEIEEEDDDGMSPADKARQAGYATGAPTTSRSPSPEPGKKAKGRAGEPEDHYSSRYGAAADTEEEEAAYSGDEVDGGRRNRFGAQDHSRDSSMDANVHNRDRSFSPGQDRLASGALQPTDAAADDFIEISPEDRAKYQIPPSYKMTAATFERFKAAREKAGRESMRRHNEGLDD